MGTMWMLVVFVGAFLLLAVIIYAKFTNRVPPREHRETERATKRLYEDGPVEDQGRGTS